MQVIPVLDLLDGHVVRAVRGERTAYLPIQSPLAATSEPLHIARALIAASGARTLYIADLGAILQRGAHVATLAMLRAALPGIDIWLDAGYADFASMRALFDSIERLTHIQHIEQSGPAQSRTSERNAPNAPATHDLAPLVPVFGTESLRDLHALQAAEAAGLSPILSLDHRAGQLLADPAFEPTSSWWPGRVIAMTLDQVGSYDGPDLRTVERIRSNAPAGTAVIGAGGIRDRADLSAAARTGATAWLVASALHDRQIGHPLFEST
jgi:phosphoribosylformimino-5-aminoimidazole carboxamide ribotide isomerase